MPGNSSRSAKARRATPHGQGTPGKAVRSRTVGLAGKVRRYRGGGYPKLPGLGDRYRGKISRNPVVVSCPFALAIARSPAVGGSLGVITDRLSRL